MEIISKKQAREKGLNFYYTGKPCSKGHKSVRYLDGHCRECKIEFKRNYRKTEKGKHKTKFDNCRNYSKDYHRYWKRNKRKTKEFSEKENKYMFLWRQLNKDKTRRYNTERARALKYQTPVWLTENHILEIDYIYKQARDCELVTGETYHVDHVIPLRGKGICGLHVPWNLQVLPSDINLSKNNRW